MIKEKDVLMTVNQCAEWLQLDPQTIYRKIKIGEIPAKRLGNGKGRVRISKKAVLKKMSNFS